jgi:SAM-dependent methyltransferase
MTSCTLRKPMEDKSSARRLVPRPIHPFPARMAAGIPWEELSTEPGQRLRVLDPMTGSGTTLVVARALGHDATGFDTDPLAVLIAKAWCENVDQERLRRTARRVLERASQLAGSMRVADAYPKDADDETRRFVRYWFDRRNRKELAALARIIQRVHDAVLRVLLLCAYSRLIIAKQAGASLALDLAHSRPHRVLDKPTIVRPLKAFLDEVERVCIVAPFAVDADAPPARVREGDARALPLEDGSVDVVITSPPYVNGIDYQRMTKFSLVWMGHSVKALRRVRSENIGTEVAGGDLDASEAQRAALRAMGVTRRIPSRTARILGKYVRDMDGALREIARVLSPGGRAVIVIGDGRRGEVHQGRGE